MSNKRPNPFELPPPSKIQTSSTIFDKLYNYFNEQSNDEENYIKEVSEYFKMLEEPPDDTCPNLPDVKKNNYTFEDLSEGQQIYITGEKYIIYIIKEKNVENKTIKIQQNNINRIDEGNIISADKVENIININPDSLHIDPTYLAKINTTNPDYFENNTKEGLILKIKYYKTKITICKIMMITYKNKDSLVAYENEEQNLKKYQEQLKETIEALANLPDYPSITIDDIKKNFRGLYGIGNMSNALDIFNNNIFTTFFNLGVDKDVIIRKYIILMDCLSVIGIAGIVEFTNSLSNGRDPKSGWVYFCINEFITNIEKTVPVQIRDVFINYALLPCISYYLSTNMDTLYLITNNSFSIFFEYILCGLNKVRILKYESNNESNVGVNRINEDDDNDDASSVSERTITTISTFPSLSIQSLYNSQKIESGIGTYSEALTNDLKIITQDNSLSESSQNSTSSSLPSLPLIGGKIKQSRMTKKHKRITIRRSKRSKKMKGGKRTLSTKKRRVVRRKRHNTKRR